MIDFLLSFSFRFSLGLSGLYLLGLEQFDGGISYG